MTFTIPYHCNSKNPRLQLNFQFPVIMLFVKILYPILNQQQLWKGPTVITFLCSLKVINRWDHCCILWSLCLKKKTIKSLWDVSEPFYCQLYLKNTNIFKCWILSIIQQRNLHQICNSKIQTPSTNLILQYLG